MWATVTARKMAKDVVLGVRCPSHGVKFDILIVICSLDTTNTQEGMHQACLPFMTTKDQQSIQYTLDLLSRIAAQGILYCPPCEPHDRSKIHSTQSQVS